MSLGYPNDICLSKCIKKVNLYYLFELEIKHLLLIKLTSSKENMMSNYQLNKDGNIYRLEFLIPNDIELWVEKISPFN